MTDRETQLEEVCSDMLDRIQQWIKTLDELQENIARTLGD